MFCFVFCFSNRVSLCGPVCPGTHYVVQADFELTEIACFCFPSAGIKSIPRYLVTILFLNTVENIFKYSFIVVF